MVGDIVPMAFIAQMLGVSGNQVYMWHQRRAKNGFPEAVACTLVPQFPGDKRRTLLFDVDEVVEWYAAYDPLARHGKHWAEKRKAGTHNPKRRRPNRKDRHG